MISLLRQRCATGCAVILATHNVRHAAWADRVVFLTDGRVAGQTVAWPGPECLLETGQVAVTGTLVTPAIIELAGVEKTYHMQRAGDRIPRAGRGGPGHRRR